MAGRCYGGILQRQIACRLRLVGLPYLELVQLFIGGMITLTVTAIVQIFVIPMVQRRTRRLERWEEDLVELATMHDEEMGAPLDRHSGAVIGYALALDQLQRGE